MISPWNSTIVTEDNPYYIQLRPSLRSHAYAITHYLRSQVSDQEVLLLCKNDERDSVTLTYFQQANLRYALQDSAALFTELIIEDIADPELSEELTLMIAENDYQTFIVPNWSDEPFVISTLARINFSKARKKSQYLDSHNGGICRRWITTTTKT